MIDPMDSWYSAKIVELHFLFSGVLDQKIGSMIEIEL